MAVNGTAERDGAFPHINGGLMQSYVGKNVSVMGKFQSVEGGGKMVKVQTTDGSVIIAVPKGPLSGPIESGSYILVQGKVDNRNKLSNALLNIIPAAMCETFDDQLWNDMISALIEFPEYAYEADIAEHFGTSEPAADGSNLDIIPFPDANEVSGDPAADGKAAGADQSFGDDIFEGMGPV